MPTVRVHDPRPECGDARVRVEVGDEARESPVGGGRVLVQHVHVPTTRRANDRVVVRPETGAKLLPDHLRVGKTRAHHLGGHLGLRDMTAARKVSLGLRKAAQGLRVGE